MDHRPDNDHWHTLAGARACPDKCMDAETIAALEASEARGPAPQCPHDPCRWRWLPPEPCTFAAGTCERLWAERYMSLRGRSAVAFREHVHAAHHGWLTHREPVDPEAVMAAFSAAIRTPRSPAHHLLPGRLDPERE